MRFLITTVVMWTVIFVITFFTAEGFLDFKTRFFGSLVFAVIASVGIFFGDGDSDKIEPHNAGVYSCRKCGHIGARTSRCPRCGSELMDRIK